MSSETRLHLPSLSVKGFRGLPHLSIPRLGHVTLIAGMNNTGKTSILEAVRLFVEEATPDVIREILQLREQNVEGLSNNPEAPDSDVFFISALFNGFPTLSEISEPIVISSCDGSRQMRMQINWFRETTDGDGNAKLIPDASNGYDSIPALVVKTGNRKRVYRIDRLNRRAASRFAYYNYQSNRVLRFVSPSTTERTEMLGPLWDNISLTPREPYIIEALQIIEPQISGVSVIGQQDSRNSRIAIVSANNLTHRVPLRSFGDGLNRLFSIILSLVNASNGILLIDEFENGMHYSVQVDAWRMIFRLARELNVQVLATTHSSDCIAGFTQAASESEDIDGLLARIDQRDDQMRVVEYTEEDLQIAVSQRIEVR